MIVVEIVSLKKILTLKRES